LTGPILPQLAASSLQIYVHEFPNDLNPEKIHMKPAVCYSVFPAKIRNAKDIPFPHNKSFSYRQKSALEPWAIIKAENLSQTKNSFFPANENLDPAGLANTIWFLLQGKLISRPASPRE
jgi:hypothetical protein